MTADRDSRFSPGDPPDDEFEEEEAPRSIFSAAWFRVVLVLLGIGVVGAVAVPYVLDVVNPPADTRTAIAPTPAPTTTPPTPPSALAPSPSPGTSASKPPTTTPPQGESARSVTPPSSPSPAPAPTAPTPTAKAPAAKPPAADKPAEKPAEKPVEKAEKVEKPAEKVAAAKKAPAEKSVAAEKPAAAEKSASRATVAKATAGGDYFVQVGAFRDQATAKRVAAQLRDQKYPVDESVKRLNDAPAAAPRPTPRTAAPSAGPDRYDVIVSGGSAAEINTRLAAKGLASEPAGDSVRIRPSLPLRDAVALSKDLGSEGFKVQVRRGGGSPGAEPAPSAAPSAAPSMDAGGQTLYRVRVGGFPDRAAAQTVLKELQDKGFQPFIAKGRD